MWPMWVWEMWLLWPGRAQEVGSIGDLPGVCSNSCSSPSPPAAEEVSQTTGDLLSGAPFGGQACVRVCPARMAVSMGSKLVSKGHGYIGWGETLRYGPKGKKNKQGTTMREDQPLSHARWKETGIDDHFTPCHLWWEVITLLFSHMTLKCWGNRSIRIR